MNRRTFLCLPALIIPAGCHRCGGSFATGYDHERGYSYTRVFPLHGRHYCSERCRIIGGYLDGWYGSKTMRMKLRFLA